MDADKESQRLYLETILNRRLLADDGLLVVDNTLFMNAAARPIFRWLIQNCLPHYFADLHKMAETSEAVDSFNKWLIIEKVPR